MMKADLKRASFRDVPFSIESHELESGRRVAIHEYPGSSQCFTEDLGRQKRVFLVNGFVSGRFCRSERDRLLTACEAEGPGELIHPHYGKRMVACTGFRVSESALERGIIYFTLSFVESEPELKVSLIPDFLKNNVAFQTVASAMEAIESIASGTQDFASNLGGKLELLEQALGPVFAVHEASINLQSAIIQIKNDLRNLSLEPGRCARSLADFFAILFCGERSSGPILSVLAPVLNASPQNELSATLSVLTVATVAQGELENQEESEMETLFQMLENAMPHLGNDSLFGQAQELRVELARFFQDQAEVRTHTIPEPMPSLVLCANLQLPLEYEPTFLEFNAVANPCFVPRGEVFYERAQ